VAALIGNRFRWVACQIEALKRCLDYHTLKEALSNLPESLDETYLRILKSIPREHKRQATTILRFLAWSDRPLRLEEMVDAIAVLVDEEPCFKPLDRMPEPSEIIRYCPGLVDLRDSAVKQYLGDSERPGHGQELHLTHLSVKEYLTTNRLNQATDMISTESVAKANLAAICLRYLTHVNRLPSTRVIRARFVFSEYCARYWATFAVVGERVDPNLRSLILSSLQNDKWKFTTLWHYFDEDKKILEQVESALLPQPNPLCYAAMKGLVMTTTLLLEGVTGTGARCQSSLLDAALWVATARNHLAIVQILLQSGADPNTKNDNTSSVPLQMASAAGYEKIVQTLLDGGADIHAVGNPYGVALNAASATGQQGVVKVLLERGANVNLHLCDKRFPHATALAAAIYGKSSDVALVLLDHGACFQTPCGKWDNALQAASFHGLNKVVRKLLDTKGIETSEYGGALQAASFRGNDAVVDMLLKKGADVNARGFRYGSPLRAAVLGGDDMIVRLLLRYGADINCPLNVHIAAVQADDDSMFDHNMFNVFADNALDLAIPKHNGTIEQTLLDLAISEHSGTIIQTLLEYGLAVTLGNIIGALRLYSRSSITLLLPHLTLDMMSQTGEGTSMNILHWAAKTGSRETVERCLQLGADVQSRGVSMMTALHHAAQQGHLEVAKLLVENGSDVQSADKFGRTPLRCANALVRHLDPTKIRKQDRDLVEYLEQLSHRSSRMKSYGEFSRPQTMAITMTSGAYSIISMQFPDLAAETRPTRW